MVVGCFELFCSWHAMRLDSCRLRKWWLKHLRWCG
jgi:hypothetical protein